MLRLLKRRVLKRNGELLMIEWGKRRFSFSPPLVDRFGSNATILF